VAQHVGYLCNFQKNLLKVNNFKKTISKLPQKTTQNGKKTTQSKQLPKLQKFAKSGHPEGSPQPPD
jgi:hypothetical protein